MRRKSAAAAARAWPPRRRRADGTSSRAGAAWITCILAAGVLGACGATKPKDGQFASYGSGAGQLHEPFGIASNWRSGDVYVVDTNNSRVNVYTAGGTFIMSWGWGVADGRTHAPQTCTRRCVPAIQGHGPGQFQFPEGVAVDNDPSSPSRGDIYVADIYNRRVQKLSPTGEFLSMFGGGVNHTAMAQHRLAEENVCPLRPGDVCGAGVEGDGPGQLELTVEGSFVAVGPEADVYVGDRNAIKVFAPSGRYLRRIDLIPAPKPEPGSNEAGGVNGLAIDGKGDMYVIRHGITGVREYTRAGQPIRTLEPTEEPAYDEGPAPAVAVDPRGDVFVDVYYRERHRIDEFGPDGIKIASFDEGPKSPPSVADREDGLPGMAYDPVTKKLYVVNADINLRPRVARVRMVSPPRP